MTEHGPGVTWLAARAGCSPEDLLGDPRRLLDALGDAGRAAVDLAVRLGSNDETVRVEAEREANELRRMFDDASDSRERRRAALLSALRRAADRVRAT